jgi:uncharacterized DUF497 family protein
VPEFVFSNTLINILLIDDKKFDWDIWNIQKNLYKHLISPDEAESVFEDDNLILIGEQKDIEVEVRYAIMGKSFNGNILFIVFTLREGRFRIISSRKTNKLERKFYEEKKR